METTTCIRERMPMVWAAVKASVRKVGGGHFLGHPLGGGDVQPRLDGKKTGVRPYVS